VASRKVTKIAVDTIAYVTETMVFLFLGIGMIAFKHPFQTMDTGSIIMTLVNLNLSRFLNIFIVTWLVNRFRTEKTRISGK